jgi:demethylmenaquinone methyltransferase/2-methoxy-6-polyprenyl-1,4-benzoquinol methylase
MDMPPSNKASFAFGSAGVTKLMVWSLPIFLFLLYTLYIKYMVSIPSVDYGTGNMFDKIAPRYDLINRVLALNMDMSWRQTMVDEVVRHVIPRATTSTTTNSPATSGGEIQILDLATGTADVAILLADTLLQVRRQEQTQHQQQQYRFQIIGVDPSEKMIQHGQSKVHHKNMQSVITLHVGDARNLRQLLFPIADSSMDAVTMAFGMRNVPPGVDRRQAFCEIYRVLKKETGILAILEFSEPSPHHGILGSVARVFIRYIVPTIGALLSGASREYLHLQNSIDQFPTPTEFIQSMEHVRCPRPDDDGTFQVNKLHEMNFGSVQLYLASPIKVPS